MAIATPGAAFNLSFVFGPVGHVLLVIHTWIWPSPAVVQSLIWCIPN